MAQVKNGQGSERILGSTDNIKKNIASKNRDGCGAITTKPHKHALYPFKNCSRDEKLPMMTMMMMTVVMMMMMLMMIRMRMIHNVYLLVDHPNIYFTSNEF